ncbi:site-2 protease family protein [Microbacter margulisiae]|uniref:Zn-dependent protease n=1 Tax=Microbacter margulisiae TaxID=1350067 RepID=A0A7W5DST3_9PORP|nr:site-2 protease family protein [Microbacter margulisiae]MBB3188266.1 Zn-dependent protease [Microbacter margulisiae]
MNLTQTLEIIPAAVIGLTVHEFSHAYAAYRLGDTTAKELGRVSLNPLKHIDWIGFFLIVVAGFGWAKPVTFNPQNLKNKHRDEILISIAGPLSNLILAILFFVIARILYFVSFFNGTDLGLWIINLIVLWGVINIALFIFNLIPLPPLDGSHVYLTYIQDINPKLMVNLYKYGTAVLFAIIIGESWLHINILHISEMINAVSYIFLRMLAFPG